MVAPNNERAAAAYLRVSTTIQGDANGTDSQRAAIERWAARHRAGEIRWYLEQPTTGATRKNRPELRAMLDAVESGEIGRVIVYDLARVSRTVSDACEIIETIATAEAQLVCVKDDMRYDGSGPMQKAMLHIMAVIAELERNISAQRISDGVQAKLERGERWGGSRVYDPNRNGCVSTTPEQDAAILARRESGQSVLSLAREYGTTRGTIGRAIRRAQRMAASR